VQEREAEHADGLRNECREAEAKRAADKTLSPTWRDNYTCGYARFAAYDVDAFTLWKRLMARTEALRLNDARRALGRLGIQAQAYRLPTEALRGSLVPPAPRQASPAGGRGGSSYAKA
jgi:hypothetical protein